MFRLVVLKTNNKYRLEYKEENMAYIHNAN